MIKPKPKRKGGLISEHSKWIGRWGVYWKIQQFGIHSSYAEELAVKYPETWELRLILWQQKSMDKDQCSKTSPSSTGSSSQSS